MSVVYAPFTIDQVESLNGYQDAGVMHPFTCGNRNDGGHPWRPGQDKGQLTATQVGWVCPDCDYTQDWANSGMANGAWRELLHSLEHLIGQARD